MIICQECFSDQILKSEIIGRKNTDKCDICLKDGFVYNTNKDDYLELFFNPFLDIFSPYNEIPNFPMEKGKLLKTEIATNWDIFTTCDEEIIYKIISEICKEKFKLKPTLLNSIIGIRKMYDSNYFSKHSLLKGDWEDFVNDLKYNNRFHSNHFNKGLLKKYCSTMIKYYDKGQEFYRCRISQNDVELPKEKMGPPPKDKATDGRANSLGISRLYLGNSEKTTIHETRTGLYDNVCIAKFRLKEKMIVVDFKRINKISPFQEYLVDDISELAINKKYLEKIDLEMGRVMRKDDNPLDYVPTQYIADFVKSIISEENENNKNLYDGIEFRSVMNPGGYNLAIFNPDLFEVVQVKSKKISHISYE